MVGNGSLRVINPTVLTTKGFSFGTRCYWTACCTRKAGAMGFVAQGMQHVEKPQVDLHLHCQDYFLYIPIYSTILYTFLSNWGLTVCLQSMVVVFAITR